MTNYMSKSTYKEETSHLREREREKNMSMCLDFPNNAMTVDPDFNTQTFVGHSQTTVAK
jgi:hypothetical protein